MTNVMRESRTLMVFGIGKLGGPVIDVLAARYPHHRYVLISRSPDRAERRANLSRYVCAQWGLYPDISWDATDLLNVDRTASILERHQPDVVFNATTPFPWWAIDAMPEAQHDQTYSAGLGMWCALDCALPMKLSEALADSRADTCYVNGCYPDMVNAFLKNVACPPVVGIGNMSNLIPGLTLAFARQIGAHPRDIHIQLVCHHYTSLNAPSVGGCAGAPYYLVVSHPGGQLTYAGPDDTPFELLKTHVSRTRGVDGQGVTVGSAATVLASLLNRRRRAHHAPGPLGLIGGYPILIDEDCGVSVDLPHGLDDVEAAEQINRRAQQFDGLAVVSPGQVKLTETTRSALAEIVGVQLPTVTSENVLDLASEIVTNLNRRYGLDLRF